ncbi:MAG: hypothetical protein R3282_06490 [Rhodothermales bacterium]|nr:hypothetical protein [Rhodothermales bacterium]
MPLRIQPWVEKHRVQLKGYPLGDHQNGAFHFPQKGLMVIASVGAGWEHVSVSRKTRVPSYEDMVWIAQVFWSPDDCLMQLRVPDKEHINRHDNVLHWWRPTDQEIPRPPSWMV